MSSGSDEGSLRGRAMVGEGGYLGSPVEEQETVADWQTTTHEDVVAAARDAVADLAHWSQSDRTREWPSERSQREERGSTEPVTDGYVVHRMTIPTGTTQSEFRARFEDAVPRLPLDQVRELVSRSASWGEMVDLVGRRALWGFLLYWTNDVGPVVRLAGDSSSGVACLMGNHIIMERMFRYEPSVVMYAPLHVAIWSHSDGQAFFTIDKPSDQFGSFAHPGVTAVGYELDSKLAALLNHLDLSVPDKLAGGVTPHIRGH